MGTTRDALIFLRSCILVLLLFGFATSFASAQSKKVTGKVTELSGAPLPGVTVVVNGTTNGTVTDIDGNYSISNVPEDAVLVYSFVGMKVQELSAAGKTSINITMQDETIGLQEVVAIGYGTQKKKEITSSIAVVKSDEFNKGNVNSPVQLIQGKVSGLSISKAGGNPNSGFDIRLRGLSTIGANAGPLIVIDGVVGGSLDNVDPNDIESINVLKDGSAAAIYGTRGSSGVILVATKAGKRNTSVVDYNGYVTVESIAKHTDVMTATEWRAMQKETKLGTDFGGDTDWFKETTRQALSKVQNISMSGGSEKTTYRASVNYRDVEGVSLTTGFKQLNGRVNISQKAMNDKLTIDMNLGATKKEAEYGFGEAFKQATIFNPTAPVMNADPAYAKWNGYFNQTLFDYFNPVQILQENSSKGEDLLYNLSLKGTYKIVSNLTIDASYSRQGNSNQRSEYYSKKSFWVGANKNGSAVKKENTGSNSLFESTINYNGTVAKDARFSVLGGYSYQDFTYSGFDMSGGNFLTDAFRDNNMGASLDFKKGLGTVGSYKNSEKLIAFFGRVNLNVNDIWFLTASARYEGSSRFGEANKWGIFPAIGGGVEIAKFLNVSAIDNLKIRGNYGITGNRPSESYLSLLRLGPKGNFFYNGNFSPAYAPVSNANSDLKWEKKGEIDLGFDFSLFKSRITGAFDFYTRTTTDLLFSYQVPVPPNLYDQAMLNLGEIKSSGLELAVTFNAIRTKDFSYSTTLTPSYNLENTLVSLSGSYNGDELKYGVRDLGNMGAPGQNGTPL
ncbi:MAG: SusC/RagA family TonB-linked outer membrane protein, partial [Mariniphaga sp.]|nr:SusC/RagA family TonB-linked outer membrane protein [Mariniphaga sp.]